MIYVSKNPSLSFKTLFSTSKRPHTCYIRPHLSLLDLRASIIFFETGISRLWIVTARTEFMNRELQNILLFDLSFHRYKFKYYTIGDVE